MIVNQYKGKFTKERFQNRIKNFSNDLSDISSEISFILDNFDSLNDKTFQLDILEFLKKVSDVDDLKTINTLSSFPLVDFLLTHFQSISFENEKEIFIEIIGSLIRNCKSLKTDELLDFFLSQLFSPIPDDNENINLLYHILYAIYQFFSKKYYAIFEENNFFQLLSQLFNTTPEIDMLLLQFALKSAKSFQFNDLVTQFIISSLEFYSDSTSDIISLIIYSAYKRNPNILEYDSVSDMVVNCLCYSDNYYSQKYALKILSQLQEDNIYFLTYNPIIIDTIFEILESTNHKENHKLLQYAMPVIYRTIQLSLPLAKSLFFDPEDENNLTFLITEIILEDNYKLRNLGIKIFSQIMRNLPREIYPFLVQPELTDVLYDVLTTILDIDDNEDSLVLFITSIDRFLDTLSNDHNLLFNFILIFQSDEVLDKISMLSESENEELAEAFQMIKEKLSDLADGIST